MTRPGETVCIGLSGGADSVCLLVLLSELAGELGIKITAFHVNHCLRGEESDTDESFVKDLCAGMDIPLKVFRYDIGELAAREKKGLEETGRNMRRSAAREACGFFHADKTALAHHANDNAETVLFNMARGASAGGLKGILPVNGRIIRPLLCLEKKEIEEELAGRGIAWREDSSNSDTGYSRNMLRNVIIPALTENINPRAVRHINEAASDMACAFMIIEDTVRERLDAFSEMTDRGLVLADGVLTGNGLIDKRIVLSALERVTCSAVDLTRVHANDIVLLFEKQPGRMLDLPYNTRAKRIYEGILISKKKDEEQEADEELTAEIPLQINGTVEMNGLKISSEIINRSEIPCKIPEKQYTKWFDYDKINGRGLLRTPRSGDFIVINSAGGTKRLKKLFTDEKVPADKRKSVLCLASGHEVLWAAGVRMGESAKITKDTKTVLKIEISGETI